MVLQFFAAGAYPIFLTEERYAAFGQPLLVLADAVVRAEVCLLRDCDVQPHGGLVRVVRLLRHGVLARLVLEVFAVVPLPVVDPHGVRLHSALHRGGGAVVAAQHLSVDADQGGNCKCRVRVDKGEGGRASLQCCQSAKALKSTLNDSQWTWILNIWEADGGMPLLASQRYSPMCFLLILVMFRVEPSAFAPN